MDFPVIRRKKVNTLQVNLGYKCNQACVHCHVDASPSRTEMMNEYNISLIPEVLKTYRIKTLDITGGAPEMHPLFKELIHKVSKLNVKIIDRSNLTILTEPGYLSLANYLADNEVTIIASLPCYEEKNVDFQRGKDVFKKSIKVLKMLNELGYGKGDKKLELDLVFNPIGANLPPSQYELEKKYKDVLKTNYNVEFDNLLVLANMPIKRFSSFLKQQGKLNEYQSLLQESHNEANLESVMCRDTISVNWEGNLFDCDFNQQLGINEYLHPNTLKDLASGNILFEGKKITVAEHCFGCTAGCGSSCGGALT
ncbi:MULTISPECIES: arsenosugar biosynthesis radical SAM (seleno)protein ArsS [Prochlorococcus]|uniref:Fe-S oxidoreductases of moaA/nifB/pqqE family n=1 Tax=Prochlorococcus marinus (strain SARG / CCMP1375 / SS120) TaxID=167539 RepID=Q7VCE5_PROMA|nr:MULTISPECIES: arsenosugar biosynthesis radical SAM (seleno)protein ArsS [Prochlorococcus]AAP99839.1 Fe-S oxidoreductases of moaA/nifB/pqqE family [Prochlorococcus marinus subsp. marinus str. CCMP1375]KGG11814.1 hypothetical protein EV04_0839 [Prochlorococcus marinus str. LG]KGG21879.1 hypothetical protein EV08_0484 [Prochlorococcus marinus str. SS2]KGG23690.1 hypothetical protein EV09_1315 [Prochlorococcus marinus str. SS35]KGG32074.1 hypothetical protein EV10_1188 [Prochlorococcus marinus 